MKAENAHLRHVGEAMVVFREAHISPFFVTEAPGPGPAEQATCGEVCIDLSAPNNRTSAPLQIGRRRLWDADAEKAVWLAPDPVTDGHAINVKRRLVRRQRELERRTCRVDKHGMTA